MKKPIYKQWWFLLIAGVLIISVVAALIDGDFSETEKKPDAVENEPEKVETAKEPDASWDDMKENIIGKSEKDFKELTKAKPGDVRNDKTGKWKKTKISESVNIEEYALSYADNYIKDDEIHFIVNFSYNTTTQISITNSLIYVDVKEYVDKEELDADKLGSGTLLKSYVIYPDGDIEEVE